MGEKNINYGYSDYCCNSQRILDLKRGAVIYEEYDRRQMCKRNNSNL